MHTPFIPGTGASKPEDTPVEEFGNEELDATDYTGSDGPRSEEASQRPTGSGGSAAPPQVRRMAPPE